MSLEPKIKVGDKITFECTQRAGRSTARWMFEKIQEQWTFKDTTGNGVWAKGYVSEIKDNLIKTAFTIDGSAGTGYTWWPAKGSRFYNPEQWTWQGFLRIIPQCACGSESVYGASAPHADWCPKYKEV